jgi:hypothetical protein
MGFLKGIKMTERAESAGDKYVCKDCFSDRAIQEFIENQAVARHCDYCGKSSSKEIAVPVDEVVLLILEGIESEWGNADDEGVPYESAEGGYQWPTVDTQDLLDYEIYLEIENEDLKDDICRALPDYNWHKKESQGPELPLYSWRYFSNLVKHRTRFFFWQEREKRRRCRMVRPDTSI